MNSYSVVRNGIEISQIVAFNPLVPCKGEM